MIRIKIYTKNIVEGKIDDLKAKFRSSPETLQLIDLFAGDPVNSQNNNKYLEWMLKHVKETTPEEMLKSIKDFHFKVSRNYLPKKDINQYSSFDDLESRLAIVTNRAEEEEKGTIKIYEDSRWKVDRPINEYASCKLGSSTSWCVAKHRASMFSEYSSDGVAHYFVRDKSIKDFKDPNHYFSYTFYSPEKIDVINAGQAKISRERMKSIIGEDLEDKIFSLMYKNYTSGQKSVIDHSPIGKTVEDLQNAQNPEEQSNILEKYFSSNVNVIENPRKYTDKEEVLRKLHKDTANLIKNFNSQELSNVYSNYVNRPSLQFPESIKNKIYHLPTFEKDFQKTINILKSQGSFTDNIDQLPIPYKNFVMTICNLTMNDQDEQKNQLFLDTLKAGSFENLYGVIFIILENSLPPSKLTKIFKILLQNKETDYSIIQQTIGRLLSIKSSDPEFIKDYFLKVIISKLYIDPEVNVKFKNDLIRVAEPYLNSSGDDPLSGEYGREVFNIIKQARPSDYKIMIMTSGFSNPNWYKKFDNQNESKLFLFNKDKKVFKFLR